MSGKPADQDNSIEEILASIRQIISEDEPATPAPAAAPVAAVPAPAPVSAQESIDDVFELVDRVVAEEEPAPAPAPEPVSAFSPDRLPPVPDVVPEVDFADIAPEPEPEPLPELPPLPVAAPVMAVPAPATGPIFTDTATAATLGAFSKLSDTILVERQRAAAASSVTLEDITKELLTPILREWVNQHVPSLVERLVREELEKITRST